VWVAVVSRVLLAACAVFWLLLIAGLVFSRTPGSPAGAAKAVLGGFVLTFIPGCLGVLLEVAYRKRRRAVTRS
jgi:hypothetical protein